MDAEIAEYQSGMKCCLCGLCGLRVARDLVVIRRIQSTSVSVVSAVSALKPSSAISADSAVSGAETDRAPQNDRLAAKCTCVDASIPWATATLNRMMAALNHTPPPTPTSID